MKPLKLKFSNKGTLLHLIFKELQKLENTYLSGKGLISREK